MGEIKTELAEWIADFCGNDEECEQKLRKLMLQDKELVRSINVAFNSGNVPRIQQLIKNYLSDKRMIIRTCKACNKKNFISSHNLVGMKCEQCDQLLLQPKKVDTDKVEVVKLESKPIIKEQERKCIYCGNPVSLTYSRVCSGCSEFRYFDTDWR
ncbi:hypothetical protein V7157_23410 [Neobacillus drentensis]|uniref:hypothetical protein n=1 Tax=Neobacillus drentensis TaxID=220684 RepID=UPI0030023794